MASQNSEAHSWQNQASPTNRTKVTGSSRFVAKSFYQEMKRNGFSSNEILDVSCEILGLVTSELIETRQS